MSVLFTRTLNFLSILIGSDFGQNATIICIGLCALANGKSFQLFTKVMTFKIYYFPVLQS